MGSAGLEFPTGSNASSPFSFFLSSTHRSFPLFFARFIGKGKGGRRKLIGIRRHLKEEKGGGGFFWRPLEIKGGGGETQPHTLFDTAPCGGGMERNSPMFSVLYCGPLAK